MTNSAANSASGAGITFTSGFDAFLYTDEHAKTYLVYETTEQGTSATEAGTLEMIGIDLIGTPSEWTMVSGVLTFVAPTPLT